MRYHTILLPDLSVECMHTICIVAQHMNPYGVLRHTILAESLGVEFRIRKNYPRNQFYEYEQPSSITS